MPVNKELAKKIMVNLLLLHKAAIKENKKENTEQIWNYLQEEKLSNESTYRIVSASMLPTGTEKHKHTHTS